MMQLLEYFFMHINAFLRKAVNKSTTRPSYAHLYSGQKESSAFVN